MLRINGVVNYQIEGICGVEHPNEHNPMVKNSTGVMTWCAISNERVIGPYLFDN